MNNKGDVSSIIYVVMFLAIVGIIIFLVSHINSELFTELQKNLNSSDYNNSEAYEVTGEFLATNESSLWDYAFLGIFFGSLIAIGLSAYAIRVSPIFYWVYGLLSLVTLSLGVILSNIWQGFSSNAEFATTLTRFPIMNSLLGTWYPTVVTAIAIIAMVILFGKPPGREEGYI